MLYSVETFNADAPILVEVHVLQGISPTVVQQVLQGVITGKEGLFFEDIYQICLEWKKAGNADFKNREWVYALKQ